MASGPAGGPVEPEIERAVAAARTGGQPLASALRAPLEDAFHADFGSVRLHSDTRSTALNRAFGARAFTVGSDVFLSQPVETLASDAGLELLSHELTHTLQRNSSTSSPTAGRRAAVVHRAIGFEFELADIRTSWWLPLFGQYPLKKKDRILTGRGFTLEADDMENYSDAEFVTDAFPETPEGGQRLIDALNDIADIVAFLEKSVQNTEISASTLPNGTATLNRYLRVTGAAPLLGKPQATAGVKLDALDRLFEEVAYRPKGDGENSLAAVMFGGQMAPNVSQVDNYAQGYGMADVRDARAAVLAAINSAIEKEPGAKVAGTPAAIALLTQLTMYLVVGAVGSAGYAKLISGGFMSRTDFATTFRQVDSDAMEYFVEEPQRFVDLVITAAQDAVSKNDKYEGNLTEDGPIFEGGIYNDRGMYENSPKYQSEMPQVPRAEWLRQIVNGKDLLTSVEFPGTAPEKAEIESLGSYGDKMDKVGPGAGENAPLVEFRGLKPLYARLLLPMALDLFRYVHILNTGGREEYPGQLQRLSDDDRLSLATSDDKAVRIRKNLIRDALAHINDWQ